MNLFDRVFAEPELCEAPPVLVDVGAAGGVNPMWRPIARYAIGVGFEPDARDAAPLEGEQRRFKRWIFCRELVLPATIPGGQATLHLTHSPQCSSVLRPRTDRLREWVFADFFRVTDSRTLPARTLGEVLAAQKVERVDWLKCDTQGLDLGIFRSLPPSWRNALLAVEFEPGLIDAYEGEDKLGEVLSAMGREPFWLADLRVGRTPRGAPARLARDFSPAALRWVRRLSPGAPAWANARFFRDVSVNEAPLDRRAHLLLWVFATLGKQHGYAVSVAEAGRERFGEALFADLRAASVRQLWWGLWRGFPAFVWRRLARRGA